MTNAELNLAIARLLYPDAEIVLSIESPLLGADKYVLKHDDRCYQHIPNYSNNWNDLMPLVVEHKITLQWDNEDMLWDVYGVRTECKASKDPQLALAKCVLAVLQEKDND